MQALISSLHTYPLKSAQGIELDESILGAKGLPWDRHWMLIDENDCFVSQRTIRQMALLSVSLFDDRIEIGFPGFDPLIVPLEFSNALPLQVTMHRKDEPILVVSEGQTAAKWFSSVLGKNLQLVRIAPEFERSVPDRAGEENSLVELADGYPYLVTSNASLSLFNHQLRKLDPFSPVVAMNRFRPNIVLDISDPWVEMEDGLTLNDESSSIAFALVKPCKRCAIPQINPETGKPDSGAEIHRALTRLNEDNIQCSDNFFGQNAILKNGTGKIISVGQKFAI